MSPRAAYFVKRRRRLRRQHLCTRCGTSPAKAGRTLCPECIAIKAIKKAPLPSEAEQRAKAAEIKRLQHRLDLIEAGRRAVQEEIDKLT